MHSDRVVTDEDLSGIQALRKRMQYLQSKYPDVKFVDLGAEKICESQLSNKRTIKEQLQQNAAELSKGDILILFGT